MKKILFTGACTALVTPFENGKLNFRMLGKLIERQRSAGIHTIVLGGTTGESPTLSDGEKLKLFSEGKKQMDGGLTVCGTGSNDTRHAVALSRAAEDSGADALLVVSPYYNKSTPQGLVEHYAAIASAVHIPVIIYNVPSRTGVDIPVDVYWKLSGIPNIAGVKEASTDVRKIGEIREQCPPDFGVWSGNDDLTVPVMSLGGAGVISVVSNVAPGLTLDMTAAALNGDFDTAAALQTALAPLCRALFREVNPIPVKAAMEILGFDCGAPRRPLTPATEETRRILKKLLT